MKRLIETLVDRLNLIIGGLSGFLILIIGFIVTYEVIMRYFFRAPTTWVLEISIYLCIGSIFLAGGYALREKAHIQVDLVTSRLSYRNQVLFQLIGFILAVIYCSVLVWKGAGLAIGAIVLREVSPTVLNVPMVIPRSFIPIGGFLLILEFIRQILAGISDLKKAEREENRKGTWMTRNLHPILLLAAIVFSGAFLLSRALAPIGLTALLFVLIFSGMPIAFGLGLLGLMGFYFTLGGGPVLVQLPLVAYKVLDDFVIVSIPLFTSLSVILSMGGIGADLFNVASTWVRHLPGGLGVATIFACAIFAAISGSSTATVATIGIIAIPEMLSRGYQRQFVFGAVSIGGVLGPLIPPSVFMILIGSISGDSVGKLFMAGMVPGIILAIIFSIYIIIYSQRKKIFEKVEPASWKERIDSIKKAFFGLLAPVIILGGIYSGIFTPTEAAGVGLTYSFLVCTFVYRTLSLKKLCETALVGARLNATIGLIVAGALIYGQVVTMLKIPDRLVEFLAALSIHPLLVLSLTLVFILILGALMDEVSILLITYPTLHYVFVTHFGFDSIWFALVFVVTLEVGLVAPPVGINLFVVQGIYKSARFSEVVKGVVPFMLLMIASILLFLFIKPLATWLPSLIG